MTTPAVARRLSLAAFRRILDHRGGRGGGVEVPGVSPSHRAHSHSPIAAVAGRRPRGISEVDRFVDNLSKIEPYPN